MMNHTNCDHEATKAARAQCRKQQAALLASARELVAYFDANGFGSTNWLYRAARQYCDFDGDASDREAIALFIITHPRMQDTDYNRRNGYRAYTTPSELLSRIYRTMS